jgi:uncharacterized protein YbaR (Trm112 family)
MSAGDGGSGMLVCPTCGLTYSSVERFCPVCKMPLAYTPDAAGSERISERHERARKVKPQLAEGKLHRVAGARHQAEAEFIQGLLLEEGVPSLIRRSAGFDVPDFLAAGPRDVLVPEAGVATAREVLLEADLIPGHVPRPAVAPARLLTGLLVALALGALVIWLGTGLTH